MTKLSDFVPCDSRRTILPPLEHRPDYGIGIWPSSLGLFLENLAQNVSGDKSFCICILQEKRKVGIASRQEKQCFIVCRKAFSDVLKGATSNKVF